MKARVNHLVKELGLAKVADAKMRGGRWTTM